METSLDQFFRVRPRRLFDHERAVYEWEARQTAKKLGHTLTGFNTAHNYGYDIEHWNNRRHAQCLKCGAQAELCMTDYLPSKSPLSGDALVKACTHSGKRRKFKVGRLPPQKDWRKVRRAKGLVVNRRFGAYRQHVQKWATVLANWRHLPDAPQLWLKAPGRVVGRCTDERTPRLDWEKKNIARNAYRAMDRIAIRENLELLDTGWIERQKQMPDERYQATKDYFHHRDRDSDWEFFDGYDPFYVDFDDDGEDPAEEIFRQEAERERALDEMASDEMRDDEWWWDDCEDCYPSHNQQTLQAENEARYEDLVGEFMAGAPIEQMLDRKEARAITRKFTPNHKRRK